MEPFPFKEEIINNEFIRTFNSDLEDDELKWHWDDEDREVYPTHETDWKFQFDDEFPIDLKEMIFIEKGKYHRLIKGTGNLILKIIKK